MGKDPAFLFYPSDFLVGCSDLTMEERGQFITLLCLQHQKEKLSEKTISLTVGKVSVDVLGKFKTDNDGNYYNERLNDEVEKRQNFIDSRRLNGLKGGRPSKPSAKPSAKHMGNLPVNENENRNKNKKPNSEEIEIYINEYVSTKKINVNAKEESQKFYDYYSSNGWKVGPNTMKDWKASVRGWLGRVGKFDDNGKKTFAEIRKEQVDAEWAFLESRG